MTPTVDQLTAQLKTSFKNDVAANTATVTLVETGQVLAIKDIPAGDGAGSNAIAAWYNGFPAVDFWVWDEAVNRVAIYGLTSDVPSNWDWAVYKAQSVPEQNAWREMFMGETANFSRKNVRQGVWEIFHANAAANALRAHIFAIGRRRATNLEKVFQTALPADVNTGNDGIAGNVGKTTNPALANVLGPISGPDVSVIRNS